MLRLLLILLILLLSVSSGSAASLSFSVTASEAVVVDTTGGVPRLTLSLGGQTRYAPYSAASSTSTMLVFVYAVQAGDFAPAGVGVTAAVDLNGATIRDLAGNTLVPAFTLAANPLIKVQTYTVDFTSAINNATATNAGLTISKAPAGASFTYTITSSGGSGSVTGTGTISANPHNVTGIDVSALPAGTLTASVTVSTAAGTGIAQTATTVPAFTGVLDGMPATAAAYSVRRLRTAYNGAILRVRRTSDNGEQDIPASVGGTLSTTDLAFFCAATSCFVRSWYDQSGNGRNLNQATASAQPRLVNAGTVELLKQIPAVRFVAASGTTMQASFSMATPVTAVGVLNPVAFNVQNAVWFDGFNPDTIFFRQRNASGGDVYANGFITTTYPWTAGTPFVFSAAYAGVTGTSVTWRNGAVVASANLGSSASAAGITLGRYPTISFIRASDVLWSELVFFPSIIATADRQALERSQGAYTDITVQ